MCLEIKCPYLAKDKTLLELSKEKDFCLVASSPSDVTLERNRQHNYYTTKYSARFMLQNHHFVTFVCGHLQNYILRDSNFERHFMKATKFFKYGVLPELLRKWFTRNAVLNLGVTSDL
uniref:YqaJ viral recombinase domain-containing protein n=1 Tax=Anguilla anguilla TaxID=7936 RepID=A0A0E9WVA0_ANGAN